MNYIESQCSLLVYELPLFINKKSNFKSHEMCCKYQDYCHMIMPEEDNHISLSQSTSCLCYYLKNNTCRTIELEQLDDTSIHTEQNNTCKTIR